MKKHVSACDHLASFSNLRRKRKNMTSSMPFTEFCYYSHFFSIRGEKKRSFMKVQSVDILDFIGHTISGPTTQL